MGSRSHFVIFFVCEVALKFAMRSMASSSLRPWWTSEKGFFWRLCFDFLIAETAFFARDFLMDADMVWKEEVDDCGGGGRVAWSACVGGRRTLTEVGASCASACVGEGGCVEAVDMHLQSGGRQTNQGEFWNFLFSLLSRVTAIVVIWPRPAWAASPQPPHVADDRPHDYQMSPNDCSTRPEHRARRGHRVRPLWLLAARGSAQDK